MASSSSKLRTSFQVFVSFRDEDVGNNFVGHLYTALDRTGIFTQVIAKEKGEDILTTVTRAIEESDLAIIVFSEDFAYSQMCLEEVAIIMECKKRKKKLKVFPVFYKVEAIEVSNVEGSHKSGMEEQEERFGKDSERVKRWKKALHEAGRVFGWQLNDGMSEATAIKEIIKAVSELTMYDVFLSFRGKDVRENFVSRLNEALAQKDINAFVDSEKLLMGQDFPPALKQAIEQSRMYVVVFSENYAESRWCLKELVQILEWKDKRKQRMLPIFYRVEPWVVRGQKQSYKEALAKHANNYGTHKVKKWRDALTEAANVNGITLSDGIKDDSIPGIVEEIEKMMAEIKRKRG
ncbi:TMV resistance protein N-like [Rhodamnia argentea]|uniref:TMV resistance protein N-like n=1 Tax=Rhodamnia argentea TaxID=178133 RepID=A0ABM3GV93_9MYRT|nr:TMV resistance protein N-like [Rhodamnia argentea]XP_048128239.1 TMV resistance protein N-like [Rhodamnia argentea]